MAYNRHIANEIIIPLAIRARWLFKHIAPQYFDSDGTIIDWNIEEALSCRVERVADFSIDHNPQWALINNFGTLPKQIAHPAIPFDVESLYQPELEYCIQTMATSPGITAETLINHLDQYFSPIPPIAAEKIAGYATILRMQNQTIGLP